MKIAILALVAFAGTALPAFAQDKTVPNTSSTFTPKAVPPLTSPDVPDNGDGPQLTFEAPLHEFGIISDEKPAVHDFMFTNTGKAPLTITSVKGSCGCTVPALSKTLYQPGESGKVHVEYNPHGRRGVQHTTITVTSDDPTRPTLTLDVKSEIRPLVLVDPQVVSLGQIRKGQGGTVTATVTSRLADLKLVSATPTINTIDAKLLPGEEKEVDGEKLWMFPVEVSVLADAPVGPVMGNISIRTSDSARLLNLTVSGEVIGDVQATPARVQLAGMAPGQAAASQVSLKSRNGKAFKVGKIEEVPTSGTLMLFKSIEVVEDTSTTPPSYTLNLNASAPAAAGAMSGNHIVSTDIPGEATFKIPYFAYVRAANQGQALPPGMVQTKPSSVWDSNPSSLVPGGK